MILSRGRGYLFIHIPKTGGTALSLALEARALKDDLLVGDTPKARARRHRQLGLKTAGRLWKHSTLADLDGLVTEEDLEELVVLTLVRNPWDRAVSYYHWLRNQRFAHPAVGLAKLLDFPAFLSHPQTEAALQAWPYGAYVRTRAGEEHCNLFVRLEHLAEDIAPFEVHLGFRLGAIARSNASLRPRDWRPFYRGATAERLAELCAEDIERFGYRFDPPGS